MRTLSFLVLMVSIFALFIIKVSAQNQIECGTVIESRFTDYDQVHEYNLSLERGDRLVITAIARPLDYQDLTLDLGLDAPSGQEINPLNRTQNNMALSLQTGRTDQLETRALPEEGTYSIYVRGFTDSGSDYYLSVSCINYENLTVAAADNAVQFVQCGSIVDDRFIRYDELHRYYISLSQGDQIQLNLISTATDYEDLTVDLGFKTPQGQMINELNRTQNNMALSLQTRNTDGWESRSLPETGMYLIYARGFTGSGSGYNLTIGCTKSDGTYIAPGSVPDDPPPMTEISSDSDFTTNPPEFGFPGLAPVDFSDVARLPIPAGVPMSGAITPTGSEIIGYQFDASAGDNVDLAFTRLSGNLNLALVVIDADSIVIYQASLVTTQSMSAQFTISTTGQYTAAVYRIELLPPDAPEATAFQISATINP